MRIFIVGSGNMAGALGNTFRKKGHSIDGVFSRNKITGRKLAKKLRCPFYPATDIIPGDSDVYLLAVNDDSIVKVCRQLPRFKGIVAHTSGSTAMNVLGTRRRGVFYPLESITPEHPKSFTEVPLCIEGSDTEARRKLMKLGRTISKKCHFISSRDRARIHLGAVLVNNFTNHLMQVAFEIAGSKASRDKLLKSLAESTVRNAFEAGPHKSQTGPARRGDLKTIRKHVTMLRTKPAAQRLYRIFSREIINKYNR